jgi:hypothetical protein
MRPVGLARGVAAVPPAARVEVVREERFGISLADPYRWMEAEDQELAGWLAEPAPRRPHDIIAPPGGRNGSRTLRAPAQSQSEMPAGSVEHDPASTVAAAFSEADARDPHRQRTWVVLVDGAERY